jgi:hypothetical protein
MANTPRLIAAVLLLSARGQRPAGDAIAPPSLQLRGM